MRVISGSARGALLKCTEGRDTRPTTDRVKESLFNILSPYIYKSAVLDLFSGSGALAIEALSRGAAFADLVEASRASADCISYNLNKTRLSENARLHISDVFDFLARCNTQYDLIFMDPPYHSDAIPRAIELICSRGLLSEKGTVVCECDHDEPLPEQISSLILYDKRKYGRVLLNFFKKI